MASGRGGPHNLCTGPQHGVAAGAGPAEPDQSTRYLPGIGQQVGAVWQYLHTDALGSIRHITGEDGSVAGSWRYSPFGEIESTSGDGSLFGYTGEPQDQASGLTYLRARYYHPALGRFLTPDAIVPDVLNGQAWNAYAYVYNDPINWVDPSGYQGEPPRDPLDWFERTVRREARGAWSAAREGVRNLPNWWNDKPDGCDCADGGPGSRFDSLMWSAISAGVLGVKTTPTNVQASITKEVRTRGWFSKTPWEEVKPPPYSGTYEEMEQIMPPGKTKVVTKEGRRFIGPWKETRWRLKTTGTQVVRGIRGLPGALGLGALVDLGLQGLKDMWRCLSPAERAHNLLVAGAAGLIASAAGALAFSAAAYLAIPMYGVTVGKAAAIGIGGLVGFGVGNFGPVANRRDALLH
ncbi:MAG: RHS repeat-associated core domain-containing protein [Blastochloris sp.]|nr:RHS repeat-associated core domain-containing protein [Blastochloris sp.]